MNSKVKEAFDLDEYCTEFKLDPRLVRQIAEIAERDVKYRTVSSNEFKEKQPALDQLNQAKIRDLAETYKGYIGKELGGPRYSYVMWSVIQHSSLEMMEEYFDALHSAFLEKQLSTGAFKMLVDRYYGLKYGYQVFGSQSGFGVEMADVETKNKIEVELGF